MSMAVTRLLRAATSLLYWDHAINPSNQNVDPLPLRCDIVPYCGYAIGSFEQDGH